MSLHVQLTRNLCIDEIHSGVWELNSQVMGLELIKSILPSWNFRRLHYLDLIHSVRVLRI